MAWSTASTERQGEKYQYKAACGHNYLRRRSAWFDTFLARPSPLPAAARPQRPWRQQTTLQLLSAAAHTVWYRRNCSSSAGSSSRAAPCRSRRPIARRMASRVRASRGRGARARRSSCSRCRSERTRLRRRIGGSNESALEARTSYRPASSCRSGSEFSRPIGSRNWLFSTTWRPEPPGSPEGDTVRWRSWNVGQTSGGRRILEKSDDGAGDPQSEGAKMFRGQWLRKHEEGMERPIGGGSARTCNARSK